jgi:hypothetical protein
MNFCVQIRFRISLLHTFIARTPHSMPQLTAQQKHDILIHCRSRRSGDSEVDVATQHGANVTRQTMWNWRCQWDGSACSLKHKAGAGRPRTLTRAEVSRHVRAPILAANREHQPASYTRILDQVRQKTRKNFSLRTLQRMGRKELRIKCKATVKRTRTECQYIQTTCIEATRTVDEYDDDLFV